LPGDTGGSLLYRENNFYRRLRVALGSPILIKVILEGLAARAVRFHEQQKPGVYKKAKLANVLQWKLRELGYSDKSAEQASKEIVKKLAIRR
jgi:hypothetical protein